MKCETRRRYLGYAVLVGSALLACLIAGVAMRADRKPVHLLAEAPTFRKTPVVVDFSPTLGRTFHRQVSDAVNSVNDAVTCTVLSTTSGETPMIHLFTLLDREPCGGARPAPSTKAASTYYCPDGSVDIVVSKAGHIREAYLVFLHELGHALGLPHAENGLMSPTIFYEDWSPYADRPLPTLAPNEGRAIAARYCMEPVDAQ